MFRGIVFSYISIIFFGFLNNQLKLNTLIFLTKRENRSFVYRSCEKSLYWNVLLWLKESKTVFISTKYNKIYNFITNDTTNDFWLPNYQHVSFAWSHAIGLVLNGKNAWRPLLGLLKMKRHDVTENISAVDHRVSRIRQTINCQASDWCLIPSKLSLRNWKITIYSSSNTLYTHPWRLFQKHLLPLLRVEWVCHVV